MSWHKFFTLWLALTIGGFGWDMGRAVSRAARARIRRWRRSRTKGEDL